MRRLIAIGALALLVLAVVPFATAGTTVLTKHVDGTVTVFEPALDREWLARFEVRTTPGGDVQFGYLRLYGITNDSTVTNANNAGAIHEFGVTHVDYSRTATGQVATLSMEECIISDQQQTVGDCFPSTYDVSDGSPDTFLADAGWVVKEGNISIYTTGGQNSQ